MKTASLLLIALLLGAGCAAPAVVETDLELDAIHFDRADGSGGDLQIVLTSDGSLAIQDNGRTLLSFSAHEGGVIARSGASMLSLVDQLANVVIEPTEREASDLEDLADILVEQRSDGASDLKLARERLLTTTASAMLVLSNTGSTPAQKEAARTALLAAVVAYSEKADALLASNAQLTRELEIATTAAKAAKLAAAAQTCKLLVWQTGFWIRSLHERPLGQCETRSGFDVQRQMREAWHMCQDGKLYRLPSKDAAGQAVAACITRK